MITSKQALARYGSSVHETGMVLWDVPSELEIGVIPKRIYCNRALVIPCPLYTFDADDEKKGFAYGGSRR